MPGASSACQPLSPQGCRELAEALGDSPETAISVHLLVRGLGRAWALGEPARFSAAIVQDCCCPAEPTGYGTDAEAVWELLQAVPGWGCVEVSEALAPDLGEIMERRLGQPTRRYGDVYHALRRPVPERPNPMVRQLSLEDVALLEAAPKEIGGLGFGGPRALLGEGFVAAAIVEGGIVAIAQTYARSPRHADIGISTLQAWRGRGLATAAAAIVARQAQEAGQTPIWSTGEDNWASLRVASKLEFERVLRKVYLVTPHRP